MKIKLVFLDWRKGGEILLYSNDLSTGQFHSGTTFDGTIILDGDEAKELKEAISKGYQPCFLITP